MLHMPSAATTQHPTRATSPIGAVGAVAEAAEAVDTEAQPPHGGAMEEAEQTVQPPHGGTLTKTEPTIATHQLMDCGTHFVRLRVTDKKVININHNPKHAVPDVNASMQTYLADATGLTDIPTSVFQCSYREPDATDMSSGAKQYGYFLCGVPALLAHLMAQATFPIAPKGPLAYAADNNGNNYKLEFEEHTRKEIKDYEPIDPDDPFWLHVLPKEDCELPPSVILERVKEHLRQYGLVVRDHPLAFKKVQPKDKEKSFNKYHVYYDIVREHAKTVAMNNGMQTIDVRGMQRILIDTETGEKGTIKFPIVTKPDGTTFSPMEKALASCHVCFAPLYVCGGCNEKPKALMAGGKKAMTSAQHNEAAKLRLTKKAKSKKAEDKAF
mgnify:CR=1 FL=1